MPLNNFDDRSFTNKIFLLAKNIIKHVPATGIKDNKDGKYILSFRNKNEYKINKNPHITKKEFNRRVDRKFLFFFSINITITPAKNSQALVGKE